MNTVVMTVTNPNLWPERNQGEMIFKQMVEGEYQFSFKVGFKDIFIVFMKGLWLIKISDDENIIIDDRGEVQECENKYLAAFLKAKIDARLDNTGLTFREVVGSVFWDALKIIFKDFYKQEKIEFTVYQPGRNGFIDKNGKLSLARKDW